MAHANTGHPRLRAIAICLGVLTLGACENNLIFLERTGFNLSVNVNNDPTKPVEVNAGLQRSVVAAVPPSKDPVKTENGTRANGEASSLISGFCLSDPNRTFFRFQGTLKIHTQFASGKAARKIAENPRAAARVADARTGNFSYDDAAQKLRSYWKPDGTTINTANQEKLKTWMKENGIDPGSITFFLYDNSPLFQEARVKAVADLTAQKGNVAMQTAKGVEHANYPCR